MKKIIKGQVKSQVKEQVSWILHRVEESVNTQLEAKVLTRSSHSSRTSYAVAADLTKMELKKILIEKMEGNKSIQRSDEQQNLYKALVDAYEEDKTILESYENTAILKRRRGDDDDQERDEEKPLLLIPDNRGRRVIPFAHFINNDLEYLRGGASSRKYTTYVTKTKAADYGHIKWIEDLVPRTMWIQEPLNYDKHALWGVSHWGQKRQQFYGFAVNRESALDVYSKRRIIAITDLKIVEWHNYKHLDWISEYRHPAACGRSSTGSRKLPEEAQPNQARHDAVSTTNNLEKSDKDRAAAMIQSIDKMLKTQRIMRSLERFVGGRLYEEDFRMLQRTI
nr:hypothetical protein [Tanacetum cinerariifolium]